MKTKMPRSKDVANAAVPRSYLIGWFSVRAKGGSAEAGQLADTKGVRSPHLQQEEIMTELEITHLLAVLVGAIILTAAIFIVTRQRDDD